MPYTHQVDLGNDSSAENTNTKTLLSYFDFIYIIDSMIKLNGLMTLPEIYYKIIIESIWNLLLIRKDSSITGSWGRALTR